MKTIIIALSIALSIFVSVRAQELTPVDALIKQGMKVRMGELTGAGSKASIQNLHGLILPEGVLLKTDMTGIVVKNESSPMISDIVKVKIEDQEIPASEFVGFVLE